MTTSVKNTRKSIIKTALMAVTVIFAIGFSAFTNIRANTPGKAVRAGFIAADYIIQPTIDNFVPLSSTPTNSHCRSVAFLYCSYDVTDDGKNNIPDQPSYTSTEIDTYVTNGWLIARGGSGQRVYQ